MGVLLVALVPLVVGAVLILLIARFSPEARRHATAGEPAGTELDPDELSELVLALVGALGFLRVFESRGTGGVLDATLRDPRPLAGGRVLLHVCPGSAARGPIGAPEILSFADAVRSEAGTLKGIFVAPSGFTDEALSAAGAASAQVDLVDGPRLRELVLEALPERAAALGPVDPSPSRG